LFIRACYCAIGLIILASAVTPKPHSLKKWDLPHAKLDLQAFAEMYQSEGRAEESYKLVILKYPKSVKVLRAYVRFLREIKNDPWKAQKYELQADDYEQVCSRSTSRKIAPHLLQEDL